MDPRTTRRCILLITGGPFRGTPVIWMTFREVRPACGWLGEPALGKPSWETTALALGCGTWNSLRDRDEHDHTAPKPGEHIAPPLPGERQQVARHGERRDNGLDRVTLWRVWLAESPRLNLLTLPWVGNVSVDKACAQPGRQGAARPPRG